MHIEIVVETLLAGEVSRPSCGHAVPLAHVGLAEVSGSQVYHVRAAGSDLLTLCRPCAGALARAIERGIFRAPCARGTLVRL